MTTGAVAANAQPQEFHGGGRAVEGRGGEVRGGEVRGAGGGNFRTHEPRFGGGFERGNLRYREGYRGGYGGGYVGVGGGYGYGGGVVVNDYIPPCPGDGYLWTAGYYNGGYWVPGAWTFGGNRGFVGGYAYGRGYERGFAGRGFEGRREVGGFQGGRGGERGFGGGNHGRR